MMTIIVLVLPGSSSVPLNMCLCVPQSIKIADNMAHTEDSLELRDMSVRSTLKITSTFRDAGNRER